MNGLSIVFVVASAAALIGCATPRQALAPQVGSPGSAATACGQSPVTVKVDVTTRTIDVPEPICANTRGLDPTVEWALPAGYEFEANPPCVVVNSSTLGAGSGPASTNGGTCRIVVSEAWYVLWSLSWKYTLNFKSTGLGGQKWSCDPTIVNRDVGGFLPLVRIKCSVT